MLHRAGLEMWEGLSNLCNCFCKSRGIYYKSDVDLNTEEISTRLNIPLNIILSFQEIRGERMIISRMAQSCFRTLCD